jgi:hypothetical protein
MRGSLTLGDYLLEQAIRILSGLGFKRVEMWKHALRRCKKRLICVLLLPALRPRGLAMDSLNVLGEDYHRPFGTHLKFQETLCGLTTNVDYAVSLCTRNVLIWVSIRPLGVHRPAV